MLSRFVIAFLPRNKHLLTSWLQSLSTVILEPKKIKCHCFYFSPFICRRVMGPDAMIFVFWMLSFKPTSSLFSFTFIKRLLVPLHFMPLEWYHLHIWGCYSHNAICYSISEVVVLEILIPACDSSSLAFCMMYSVVYYIKLCLSIYVSVCSLVYPSMHSSIHSTIHTSI